MRWVDPLWLLERAGQRLSPGWAGFVNALGPVAVLVPMVTWLSIHFGLPDPPPEIFERLLQAGLGLFVAFSVTLAAIELKFDDEDKAVDWLGYGCGWGTAGLVAIAACTALSVNSISAPTWVDIGFLWWSTVSLLVLGIIIAVGPLMIYRSKIGNRDPIADE